MTPRPDHALQRPYEGCQLEVRRQNVFSAFSLGRWPRATSGSEWRRARERWETSYSPGQPVFSPRLPRGLLSLSRTHAVGGAPPSRRLTASERPWGASLPLPQGSRNGEPRMVIELPSHSARRREPPRRRRSGNCIVPAQERHPRICRPCGAGETKVGCFYKDSAPDGAE